VRQLERSGNGRIAQRPRELAPLIGPTLAKICTSNTSSSRDKIR